METSESELLPTPTMETSESERSESELLPTPNVGISTSNITSRGTTRLGGHSITELCKQCQSQIYRHQLTNEHLSFLQFWLFTVPMAFFVMISGILSFYNSTNLTAGDTEVHVGISIGCISVVVVFFGTLQSYYNFDVRSAMHYNVVTDLDKMRAELQVMRIKMGDYCNRNNEDGSYVNSSNTVKTNTNHDAVKEEDDTVVISQGESFESIQARYQQCLASCKSPVPLKIEQAYRMIDSQMELSKNEAADKYFESVGMEDWQLKLWFAAYDRLTEQFTSTRLWPMRLPDSSTMVHKALYKLKRVVQNGKNFWNEDVEYDYESGTLRPSAERPIAKLYP